MNFRRFVTLVVLLVFVLLLAACGSTISTTDAPTHQTPDDLQTTPPDVSSTATGEGESDPDATPAASPSPSWLIFVSPPDERPAWEDDVRTSLEELAVVSGLELEVRASLEREDITPAVKLVAALPPDPGLANLAASSPGVQFLGVGIPGLVPGANLSLIETHQARPDQVGFLAGIIAAVSTPDWRVAVMSLSDTPAGVEARQGFLNGVIYFCGLCQQTYPPFVKYPLYMELPASATQAEWQAAADVLLDQAVETVFLAPGAASEALVDHLVQRGVNIIGTDAPLPGSEDYWLASVHPDFVSSLQSLWPDLVGGIGGRTQAATIAISHVNAIIFTPGKQKLVDEYLEDLLDGFIHTGVDLPPE